MEVYYSWLKVYTLLFTSGKFCIVLNLFNVLDSHLEIVFSFKKLHFLGIERILGFYKSHIHILKNTA